MAIVDWDNWDSRKSALPASSRNEVSAMDNIRAMPQLVVIGGAPAKQVDLAHLRRFVDVPLGVV
jgi:hypothetical protein